MNDAKHRCPGSMPQEKSPRGWMARSGSTAVSAITWCLTMGYIVGKEAARKARELDWLPVDSDQIQEEQKRLLPCWKGKRVSGVWK